MTDKFFTDRKAKKITESLEGAGFECLIYELAGGKGSKSFAELLAIYGILESENFARDSTLIALGGGSDW